MFCEHCGKEIDNDSTFCSHCGGQVEPLEQHDSSLPGPVEQLTKNKQSRLEIHESWETVIGLKREFPFFDETLRVSREMDAFNTYRSRFKKHAQRYAEDFARQYSSRVTDLDSFIQNFLDLYRSDLDPMIAKALEILISEGIWTVTHDSLFEAHTANFHLAIDDLLTMSESIRLSIESNQKALASLTSFVPTLMGGGFGTAGAAKGIAKAQMFNMARDSIESGLFKKVSKLDKRQQQGLYARINPRLLAKRVFLDYWRVFLTLTYALRENGKAIWYPSDEATAQATNILKNISNPAFPKAEITRALAGVLEANPYSEECYSVISSKLGDTDEVVAVKQYFEIV